MVTTPFCAPNILHTRFLGTASRQEAEERLLLAHDGGFVGAFLCGSLLDKPA